MHFSILKWAMAISLLSALLLWVSSMYGWPIIQLLSLFALVTNLFITFAVLAILGSDWYEKIRKDSTIYGSSDHIEE